MCFIVVEGTEVQELSLVWSLEPISGVFAASRYIPIAEKYKALVSVGALDNSSANHTYTHKMFPGLDIQ
jgi:hypothetical protein